jgi:Cdc6-like AAA superfamily ATPase
MNSIYDLRNAKKCLLSQLETVGSLYHLDEERIKIKRAFDMAFHHKLSTSLIMVGGSGDEAVNLVRSVLETYQSQDFQSSTLGDRYTKGKNYTARVNGSLHGNDHEALADLANQFLVRSEREMSGSTLALEDLEDHFRQCRLDGIPAIIVIEDFHVFTKRKRQTLIYALLDLMHKKDLLFTVR